MELKEFVKKVLADITEGVEESKNNTYRFTLANQTDEGIFFDVAIIAKSYAEGNIGAEIPFVVAGKAEGSISEAKTNRIKFRIYPNRKLEPEDIDEALEP